MHRITLFAPVLVLSLGLALASLCSAAPVRASEGEVVVQVALLTLSSDGVHDDLARRLAEALRAEVQATSGYHLSDARVSLEQLSLVQDCDPVQPSCLGRIAKQLGVDRFIFGKLSNEGSGALAELSLFDAASQKVTRSAMVMFALRDASEVDIKRKAGVLTDQLFERVSVIPESAPAVLPSPELSVGAETESEPTSVKRVAGYALLGGAVLSVGLSVLAFVEIDRAQTNENFVNYRKAVGRSDASSLPKDVCDEAEAGKTYDRSPSAFKDVKSQCSIGHTFEVLQFVFLGAAAVSGGLSAFFLLSEDKPERRTAFGANLPFQPIVRRNSAELRARVHF